jgi:hypothetical protein
MGKIDNVEFYSFCIANSVLFLKVILLLKKFNDLLTTLFSMLWYSVNIMVFTSFIDSAIRIYD